MADDTLQTGTDTISTDHVSTLNGAAITIGATTPKVQRVKVAFGDDNTARDASTAFPLPVRFADIATTGAITAADIATTSTVGAGGQNLLTGTPTAGSAVVAVGDGASSFAVQVTGTFVATYQIDRSLDGGVTWTVIGAFAAGTAVTGTSWTVPGLFHGNASSCTHLRVRCTAFTSGSLAVRFVEGGGTGTITVGNPIRLYDVASNVQHSIKPASTPAVAADTALVVALHPQTTVRPVTSSTGTLTSVVAAATSTSLLGSTPGRLGAVFFNDSTATLYLALSGTASLTAYTTQIAGGGFYELPDLGTIYTGPASGIWSAVNGSVKVTELT